MLKAVNMKNYRFGKKANIGAYGFGILDEETNTFVSLEGFRPYCLRTKKIMQSIIDSGWCDQMERVAYTGYVGK